MLAAGGLVVLAAHSGCGSDDAVAAGKDAGALDGAQGGSGGNVATGGAWPGGTAGSTPDGSAGSGATGGSAQGGSSGTGAGGGTGGCSTGGAGSTVCGTGGPCQFPQGVPDEHFIGQACTYQDTDPSVDSAVNAVMASLTGCGVGSDCPITGYPGSNAYEVCQSWFNAVTAALRAQGYCAGLHEVGHTDEIAVSNTCCEGRWYGYHVCNYGGPKVVWNPGARRGWWTITPSYCAP